VGIFSFIKREMGVKVKDKSASQAAWRLRNLFVFRCAFSTIKRAVGRSTASPQRIKIVAKGERVTTGDIFSSAISAA
jgi:hypothetical protein